jgi:putative ABC transport system permease protein
MNQASDRKVLIPVVAAKNIYGTDRTNYGLSVGVKLTTDIDNAIAASYPVMRNVRRLKVTEANDFDVEKSDSLVDILKDNTAMLRMAALFIGIITLIGAAIGLMNIMLVSVTERTKEIGIIKAIGATRKDVVYQFMAEALLICQFGGLIGTVLGVLVGFGVAKLFDGTFVIPWQWIILGFITCMIVGLVSGIYPATKAAKMDPIESLRYE